MRRLTLIVLALTVAPAIAVAAEPTDDEIMTMTATQWAGMNCGKMIPNEDYQKAMDFTAKLDREKFTSAMRRVRFQTSKAANREVACQSVVDALPSE